LPIPAPPMRPILTVVLAATVGLSALVACGDAAPPPPVVPPAPPVARTPPAAPAPAPPAPPPPPPTRRDDFHETLHGVDIVDPYRWLEDQEAPETRAWIGAQNGYTHALLDALPGRDAIKARLDELLRLDSQGLPRVEGHHVFTWKRGARDDLW